MKVLAEVFKIPAFSEIWTRIDEFKLQIAIPFTIESIKKTTNFEFEPALAESNGLTVSRLNHSSILSIKAINKLFWQISIS